MIVSVRCIIFCPSALTVSAPVRLIVRIMVQIKAVVCLISGFVRRFRSLCCTVQRKGVLGCANSQLRGAVDPLRGGLRRARCAFVSIRALEPVWVLITVLLHLSLMLTITSVLPGSLGGVNGW